MRFGGVCLVALFSASLLSTAPGCGGGSSSSNLAGSTEPLTFDPARFDESETIDNPYYPLEPGFGAVYERETAEGRERVERFVSHQTRLVTGVRCRIVVDREYIDDDFMEETFDWYAQDIDGNVWHLGEETTRFENGEPVSREGSWEAGIDGARPGVFIKARHVVGDVYARNFAPGIAEDVVEVVAVEVPVVLSDGRRFSCLQTRESSRLDPGQIEVEYFAPGLGPVLIETADPIPTELLETSLDSRPEIDPVRFVESVDHPLFPLAPGTIVRFEGETEEGFLSIESEVSFRTKTILGVRCTTVKERVYRDGELVEMTRDWYAQDREGNVWYFGEDSRELSSGRVVSRSESWRAGARGARPGLIMPARPRVGDTYRQEIAPGVSDELTAVVERQMDLHVPYGPLEGCLKTLEWSPLSGSREFKYYAPGIGPVLSTEIDGSERIELVDLVR